MLFSGNGTVVRITLTEKQSLMTLLFFASSSGRRKTQPHAHSYDGDIAKAMIYNLKKYPYKCHLYGRGTRRVAVRAI